MKKYLIIYLLLFLHIGCTSKAGDGITIACSSNMQYAMKALVQEFNKQHPAVKLNLVIASSGKLTAQIKAGAAYDLFFSANMKYPNLLFQEGHSLDKPLIYAYGSLVLWSADSDRIGDELPNLDDPNIRHIAIANPEIAPYGLATQEYLKQINLYDALNPKLVFGESISQVNQFVSTGAAELGFTSKSVVLSPMLKGSGSWIDIPLKYYAPIEQGVVKLKLFQHDTLAVEKFYNFIFTNKAQLILLDYGYNTPT